MDSRTCTAVLVVEDDLHIRDQVSAFLTGEGFQVYRAEHGADALRVLATMPRPALVLADMMTPKIDGPELVRALQEDDRFAILPVVVSMMPTAEFPPTKKPIDLGDLLRIVDRLCLRRM